MPLTETETYGKAKYSIDGTNWQDSNVLTELKAGQTYTVYVRYLGTGIYTESGAGMLETATNSAAYMISVPPAVQAGSDLVEIKVDTGKKFDLGYGGAVHVKVKSGGAVSADGRLTL